MLMNSAKMGMKSFKFCEQNQLNTDQVAVVDDYNHTGELDTREPAVRHAPFVDVRIEEIIFIVCPKL